MRPRAAPRPLVSATFYSAWAGVGILSTSDAHLHPTRARRRPGVTGRFSGASPTIGRSPVPKRVDPQQFNVTKIEEESMHWIVTLIVGAVVGWLASILMKTNAQMGAIANIVVGIVGSSLGFWLAGVLGLSTSGPVVGWVVAVLGAALLIFILKAVGIFT